MKNYEISEEIKKQLMHYLASRPWVEVNHFIVALNELKEANVVVFESKNKEE